MTHPSDDDEPVRYTACNVDETGQGRPLPDDPAFHEAMDQVARAAVRLAKADRERQLREFLAAWLAGQQHTIAAALAALPAGMASQTQAVNVHAALLAAAGMPDATAATQWGVRFPEDAVVPGETHPGEEEWARRWVQRSAKAPAEARLAGAELVSRIVVTGGWQRADEPQVP